MTGLGGVVIVDAASPYVVAAFGLVGSLIGGGIAATVSLVLAGQARSEARSGWIRHNRREIYDRFLTDAQKLLVACEDYKESQPEDAESAIKRADSELVEGYAVMQIVADRRVVDAARVQVYRLGWLKDLTLKHLKSADEPQDYSRMVALSRESRHDTIDAMREELGLSGSVSLTKRFDPFAGTDLKNKYAVEPDARHRAAD